MYAHMRVGRAKTHTHTYAHKIHGYVKRKDNPKKKTISQYVQLKCIRLLLFYFTCI